MMLSLYAEIAACLVGASLFGLLCGWMMQRSRAASRFATSSRHWEERYAELEHDARKDVDHLEERLQSMGREVKTLTRSNQSLDESLKKNEAFVHKARADAIELNRQQVETQERLQRIIQQKEREITEIQDSASRSPASVAIMASARSGQADEFDATMRIDPSQLPGVGSALRSSSASDPFDGKNIDEGDDPFDATTEISTEDLEGAATVALDDEALAFARAGGQPKSRSSD